MSQAQPPTTQKPLTARINLPVTFFCIGLVITSLIVGLSVHLMQQNQQQQWTNEYGQALANLAARRALDSTLNHDLVSLQVILSDVVENVSVANATIHDVENNLLVQAGQRNTSTKSTRFSAPITLHNSIAGYVTVTLDLQTGTPFSHQLYWLFGFLAAGLVALSLFFEYFTRSQRVEKNRRTGTIPIVNTPTILQSSNETGAEEEELLSTGQYSVQLIVALKNYTELSQQLNSKSFRAINQRLEQQLTGVMALYSGKILHAEQQIIRLQIYSHETHGDAIFKGLCAALLLRQLNQQPTSVQLLINLMIVNNDDAGSILKRLPYYLSEQDDYNTLLKNAPDNSLLAQAQLLEDEPLASRFTFRRLDDPKVSDIVNVMAVHESYQALLDKQLQQLGRDQ